MTRVVDLGHGYMRREVAHGWRDARPIAAVLLVGSAVAAVVDATWTHLTRKEHR